MSGGKIYSAAMSLASIFNISIHQQRYIYASLHIRFVETRDARIAHRIVAAVILIRDKSDFSPNTFSMHTADPL